MAYKALYRTYRPQNFEEVVGQEMVVRTLQNSIINNKISHAYLFCGPRGTGKTTIARVFAKALNCSSKNGFEPCNNCAICQEITNGTSPDVIEIDAASNNGVEEMRDLKEKVKFLPAGTKYKIYIIDEVHMLSTSAFNALLKTLEEPPAHAIFILATTEPHKVLPTIVSRCQRFDFKSLTQTEIVSNLTNICDKENIKYDLEAIKIIANASEGGMRDALSFLDQAISLSEDMVNEDIASIVTGLLDKTNLLKLVNYLEDKKISESLKIVEELQNSGKEVEKIVTGLLSFYRDVLMCKAGIYNDCEEKIIEFSERIDIRKVYYNIDVLNDVLSKIKFNASSNIFLEVAVIKMINASSDELNYGKRISELEEKINNYSPTENNIEFDSNDLKRIRLLEEKFNNLLVELSKLDLIRWIEKVKLLENSNGLNNDGPSFKEINSKVDKIVEDLELLKVIQNGIRTELDNVSLGGIDENVLDDKIESNLKKIKPAVNYTEIENFVKKQIENIDSSKENSEELENRIENLERNLQDVLVKEENDSIIPNNLIERIEKLENEKVENKSVEIPNDLIERIEKLENEKQDLNFDNNLNQEYDERIVEIENKILEIDFSKIDDQDEVLTKLEERIKLLESNNDNNEKIIHLEHLIREISNKKETTSSINYDDRISKIESNIYKIMSGMLKPQSTKKTKNKVDDKQISIWRDDIIDVDKINNPNENIKTDFGDFAITIDKNEDYESAEVSKVDYELLKENEKIIVEEVLDAEESKEEINNDEPTFNMFEENLNDFYDDSNENKLVEKVIEQPNISNIENLFGESSIINETNYDKENEISERMRIEEELIKQEELEKIRLEQIERERLEAEEKKRLEQIEKQKRELEELRKREEYERLRRLEEIKKQDEKKKLEELEKSRSGNGDLDEYERYDVKVLERIMNDARNPEYATEKERITNLWRHLLSLAPTDKRGVAEILTEGQITAVGNHEFVIIYNNSAICNQVMSRRFKRNSLKLLYDLLNGDYNYFAITQEVWLAKRREYSEQYSIGTKYPTLTPIKDPSLKVSIDDDKNENEEMLKKMHDIFGPNINFIKRG